MSNVLNMHHGLFWKLFWTIAAGTVSLFWAVDILTQRTEQHMSYIDEVYQQQLLDYGAEAEHIYHSQGEQQLAQWLRHLQDREQTWAAVVTSQITPLAGGNLSPQFNDGFRLGRSVQWKIHLYFSDNPIMDITFADGSAHFLIRLPQRMRPGAYLQYMHIFLQIALPFFLLCVLSLVLYRHVMKPLRQLEKATRQFSEGKYDVRVKTFLGGRNDEFAALAETFDHMAERTGSLIITQRQLLADLSHELRTPLARLDMAIDCIEQGIKSQQSLDRLRYEAQTMSQLVEDALTLAWLNNEQPKLSKETVDLAELLELIVEDARFEYPDHHIDYASPPQALVHHSCHRALAQAFENIIRNALKYTGAGKQVWVTVIQRNAFYQICIKDQGQGVPEHLLEDIFKPFFRVDKARSQTPVLSGICGKAGGYGLGLALAQRQLKAVGGSIYARNYVNTSTDGGLEMVIDLPAQ